MRSVIRPINKSYTKPIPSPINITRILPYECRHYSSLTTPFKRTFQSRYTVPLSARFMPLCRWNTNQTINPTVNPIESSSNNQSNQSNNQSTDQSNQSNQSNQSDNSNQSNNQNTNERQRSKFFLLRIIQSIWRWYSGALNRRPYLVQSLTSAFLFAIGDITAQHYEAHLDEQKALAAASSKHVAQGRDLIHHHELHVMEPHSNGFSWHRLFACTMFGLAIMGPGGQFWYTKLDVVVARWYKPLTIKNTLTKVALDTIIFNPIFLIVFFSSVSLMEGASWADIRHKLYRDFVPSYAVDCSIWPLVQCFNFRFTPVNFQLLVVNLFCYFDDVFLSYVQHNGMPSIFVGIETWWLEYIGEKPKHQKALPPAEPAVVEATESTKQESAVAVSQ